MSTWKNRARALGWSACLVAASVLGFAGIAAATPSWLPPQTLAPPAGGGQGAASPGSANGVAFANDGAAAAAWLGGYEAVLVATKAPFGSFGPAVAFPVASGGSAGSGGGVDVGVDGEGAATAVWVDGSGGQVEAGTALYGLAGGRETLSPSGSYDQAPAIAVDEHGDAVAVWVRSGGEAVSAIEAAYRPAGGHFGAPAELSPQGADATQPSVAIDANGEAIVAWRNGTSIEAASIHPAGLLAGSETISGALAGARGAPAVAIDAAGAGAVAWGAEGGGSANVELATRSPGGAFSAPQEIASVPSGSPDPQVGLSAAGEVTLAWSSYSAETGYEVLAAWGPLAEPAAISTPGSAPSSTPGSAPSSGPVVVASAARSPSLAVDAGGDALLSYLGEQGGTTFAAASYRPARGGFGGESVISGEGGAAGSVAGGEAAPVAAAIDGEGDGIAAFDRLSGSDPLEVALLDAAGPVLNGLSIPTAGAVGQSVSFSVAPLDGVSSVASTSWSFGDGGSASGASVAHVFTQPGTYTVSVTAVDAHGNATTASGTIAIASSSARIPRQARRRRYTGARLTTRATRATRQGTFRLEVRCIAYTDCSGGRVRIAVQVRRGDSARARVKLGKDKFRAASHARTYVSFELPRRVLKVLRERTRLKLFAVVQTGDIRGQHATTRARVQLLAPPSVKRAGVRRRGGAARPRHRRPRGG